MTMQTRVFPVSFPQTSHLTSSSSESRPVSVMSMHTTSKQRPSTSVTATSMQQSSQTSRMQLSTSTSESMSFSDPSPSVLMQHFPQRLQSPTADGTSSSEHSATGSRPSSVFQSDSHFSEVQTKTRNDALHLSVQRFLCV